MKSLQLACYLLTAWLVAAVLGSAFAGYPFITYFPLLLGAVAFGLFTYAARNARGVE